MSKREQNNTQVSGKGFSKRKLFWFKLIGLLIPFLILFMLEISLRFFHYGYNQNLFIEYPANNRYLYFNPAASAKYFTDPAIAPTGNIELFKKEKDENSIRIFVLGESTTIGYPYFHNASFHRWLQYRLSHSFPDKNFEIINCSLTAVNSYTVLGFAKQMVCYQPDAVLIYTGHNEYYGALGVGSTDRIGGNVKVVNLLIRLRGLKLVQLMTNAYQRIIGLFKNKNAFLGKTRMELMVAKQQIPYGSALFNRGIDQFRSNMDETLACLSSHHIPVFISNLVSNEKDLKPFVSTPVDSIRYPSFQPNFLAGSKAFEQGNFAEASACLERAEQAYSYHAACNYYLGKLAYRQGNYKSAESFLAKAVNLDALRFRAPGQINETISQLCKKYPEVHLVDSRREFEDSSDHHVIGDKLILEHVHPNLLGYALLSDAFYESMKKAGIFTLTKDREISFSQLQRRMPITAMDSLTGSIKIAKLKKSWPFSETQSEEPAQRDSAMRPSLEEKLAGDIVFKKMNWSDANQILYDNYIQRGQINKAKTVVEGLLLEYPLEEAYYEKAANLCGQLKDDEEAVFYFRKAFDLAPSFEKARYLFVLYLKLDEPEEAMPYLDYASRSAGGSQLAVIKALTGEIVGLRKTYLKDSSDLAVLNEIAVRYSRMGNRDAATKYLNMVLRSDARNKTALELLARVQNQKNAHEKN